MLKLEADGDGAYGNLNEGHYSTFLQLQSMLSSR